MLGEGRARAGRERLRARDETLRLLADPLMHVILDELIGASLRPAELERRLADQAARGTLHSRLQRMRACGLVRRRSYAEAPPRVEYEITRHGLRLLALSATAARADALAHAAEPRADDASGIARVLQIASGLAELPAGVFGCCGCSIVGQHGADVHAVLDMRGGRLGFAACEAPALREADAHASAPCGAWLETLTGRSASIDLTIEGDASLAHAALVAVRHGLMF